MEQSRLGMHNLLHHEHQSLHDQNFGSSTNLRPPKISLRSMSKSDPHLNIPHLMLSQDEQHPSLNKIVSGLFHADTALNSVPHLQIEGAPMSSNKTQSALHASESTAILPREPTTTPGIRKSSSAVDWIHSQDNQYQEVSGWNHPDSTLKSNTTAFLPGLAVKQPSDHHHHHQGGLVMSSTQETKMSVIVPSAPSAPFSQSLAGSTTSSVTSVNPLEPQQERKIAGMLGNVFRQGFFSRPVVRSDEENYRYLMALDR